MIVFRKSAMLVIAALVAVVMGFASQASADGNGHGNADWDTGSLSKSDFRQYCKNVQGARVVSVAPHDAYSLRCGSLDIDVTDVCNYTYGDDVRKGYGREIGLIDRLADVGKRYDGWDCMLDFGIAGHVGGDDLDQWCMSRGLQLHFDSSQKYEAYGWFCVNRNGKYVEGIRMDHICFQWFGSTTLDRVANLKDRYSWECRYSKE